MTIRPAPRRLARPLLPLLLVALASGAAGCREPRPDPERARLLRGLKDPRPEQRTEAIRALAKGQTKAETMALARAAMDAPAPVRREIALALGEATAPEAADLLGAMLVPSAGGAESSDSVRAAAAESLLRLRTPKAKGFLAAGYEQGGPRTRAAIAAAGPEVLALAVEAESRSRARRAARVDAQAPAQLRARALEELGAHGTAEAVAELAARLEDDDSLVAAGAAKGLGLAGAADQIPLLVQAAGSPRSLVAVAAARALQQLGPHPLIQSLVPALSSASDPQAMAVLLALDEHALTAEDREELCALAANRTVPALVVEAATLAGETCRLPAALPEESEALAARFVALATLGHAEAGALQKARTALTEEDARLAAAAATYLGVSGTPADGPLLAKVATEELETLGLRRRAKAREAREARDARRGHSDAHLQAMRQLLGDDEDEAERASRIVPKPIQNKLVQLLENSRTVGEEFPFEHRPGAMELVAEAAVGAAALGAAQAEALGAALLDDQDGRLRLVAAEVADRLGGKGEALRQKVRADADRDVAVRMAERDLRAGRPGAVERALESVRVADPERRERLARALGPHAAGAREALLALASGTDSAVEPAVHALGALTGEDIDEVLESRVQAVPPLAVATAVRALSTRPGAKVDRVLADAAVHPSPEVRRMALTALADRKACAFAPGLGALADDYEVQVRRAAAALAEACPAKAR